MTEDGKKFIFRILVVDDEILIARNLQRTLVDLGHEVLDVACSGEDAIEKVGLLKPDLVFMDIRLASGMDGIEAARLIRDRFRAPVVFLTAYADEDTLSRARGVAPYGYLVKPVAERDVRIVTEMAMARHTAEILLEQSEARNRLILNTTHDAFVGMSEKGLITDWNPQAEAIFGWTRDEAIGRILRDTIIPPHFGEAHTAGLAHFLRSGEGPILNKRIELRALHRDGHEFPVELTISSVAINGTHFFSGFIHDITDRKKTEMALVESERALRQAKEGLEEKVKERTAQLENANANLAVSNTELEQFAGVAAHDLRAPIKAMNSWADMLERRLPQPRDEETEQAIGFIKFNSQKAEQLIDDLLQVARANAANLEMNPVPLEKMVADVIRVLQDKIESSGADVSVGRLPIVIGNQTYLEGLFSNLIGNALVYRHRDRAPKISISCRELPRFYEFSIKDNGIGIVEKYNDRIFQMFNRLHSESEYPGTGIGLAFCKKVVEQCGGKIWVSSVPGEGSTFYFTYPRKPEEGKR